MTKEVLLDYHVFIKPPRGDKAGLNVWDVRHGILAERKKRQSTEAATLLEALREAELQLQAAVCDVRERRKLAEQGKPASFVHD